MIETRIHHAFPRPWSFVRVSRVGTNLRYANQAVRYQHAEADSSHLPRIVQPSIWESIFPKPVRERTKQIWRSPRKRRINPQSYFLWIYLLIGSQAIRILGVQNEFSTYMRKADLKIGKLREVVEKLQRGESVDVEKTLGTGDEEQEQEWEEALREIEDEERKWQENKRRSVEEEERREAEKRDASPVSDTGAKVESTPDLPASIPRPPSQPGFY